MISRAAGGSSYERKTGTLSERLVPRSILGEVRSGSDAEGIAQAPPDQALESRARDAECPRCFRQVPTAPPQRVEGQVPLEHCSGFLQGPRGLRGIEGNCEISLGDQGAFRREAGRKYATIELSDVAGPRVGEEESPGFRGEALHGLRRFPGAFDS